MESKVWQDAGEASQKMDAKEANLWGPPFMVHGNWFFWTIYIKDLVSAESPIFFLSCSGFQPFRNHYRVSIS